MKTLLLFVAAQLAGNAISLFIAASLARLLRRRLLRDLDAYTAELKPC